MIRAAWILALPVLAACATAAGPSPRHDGTVVLSRRILEASKETYLPHRGKGKFKNYLAQVVPFEPVGEIFNRLQKELGVQLKSRGEAHITVLTPPEYDAVISAKVPIEKIEAIAHEARLQEIPYRIVCLGRGAAGASKQTFYLVVESEGLMRLRESFFKEFVKAGGEPSHFDPRAFYPHITVGFTDSDLHEADGVRKGVNSCFRAVRLID